MKTSGFTAKLLFNPVWIFLSVLIADVFGELEYKGFVDTYHAYQLTDNNEWLSSRTRLRLEPDYYRNDWSMSSVFDLEKNEKQTGVDFLTIRELYFEWLGERFDLRAGRQILIWGKTEGLQILDALSPWNYSEFLARDFDDLRIGVDGLRARYLGNDWTLEAVYLPHFQPAILAENDSPWFIPGTDLPVASDPSGTFENGELGIRFSKFNMWGDLSIVALRTWTDQPVLIHDPIVADEYLQEYQRLNVIGAGVSIPYEKVVFRGEVAIYQGYDFVLDTPDAELKENMSQLKWVVGVDWTPGNGWSVSTQITDSQVLNYEPGLMIQEYQKLMTLSISKNLFREKLKCSVFSFIGLEDQDTFTRLSINYSLNDALRLLTGVDLFTGSAGMFGAFDANDELWMKLKYSF